jgi:hypothetical protein
MTIRIFAYFQTGRTCENEKGNAIRIDPVYKDGIIYLVRLTSSSGMLFECNAEQWEDLKKAIGTAEVEEPHEVMRRAWIESVKEIDPDRAVVATEYDNEVFKLMAKRLGIGMRTPK